MSRQRFVAERENGSDWCIKDLAKSGIVVASGLDYGEAIETAEAWNSDQEKIKENFIE